MRGMDIDKLDSRTWNKIKKYKSLIGYVKFKKSNFGQSMDAYGLVTM